MVKDRRYKVVRRLLDGGDIKAFREIFEYLPKSTLIRDMGQNYSTFNGKILNPHRFTLLDLFRMSEWFELEPEELLTLMKAEVRYRLAKRKKPSGMQTQRKEQ
jgi:hypothetical protein